MKYFLILYSSVAVNKYSISLYLSQGFCEILAENVLKHRMYDVICEKNNRNKDVIDHCMPGSV